MKPVINFIKDYKRVYLIGLPGMVLFAKFFWPALLLLVPVGILYLGIKRKYTEIVLIFILTLTLADQPELRLASLMPVRMAALIAMVFVVLYHFRLELYKINPQFLHFVPFVLVTFLSTQFAPEQGNSISKGLSFILLYFVSFHLLRQMIRESGDEIIRAIVINSLLIMAIGITLIFVSRQTVYFGNVRFNGLFRNPNGLGLFLAMNLPFFHYYFKKFKPKKIFKVISITLISISLILCSSRNALLASTLFLIFNAGMRAKPVYRVLVFAGIMPIVFLVIQAISVEKIIISFGLEKYLRLNELESGSGRTHAWEFAKIHIAENLWLGKGFGYEEYLFAYMMSYNLWKTGHQGGVHNSYYGTLLNVGMAGLISLIYFYSFLILKIRDRYQFLPVLFVYFFTAIFESWMIASLNAFHIYFVVTLVFFLEKDKFFAKFTNEPALSVH